MQHFRIKYLLFCLWLFFPLAIFSQNATKILLQKADKWAYDEEIGKDIQRIIERVAKLDEAVDHPPKNGFSSALGP